MKFYTLAYLLACMLFFVSFSLNGQERPGGIASPGLIVKGTILDLQNNTPLEFATISIFSKSDSSLITGAMTDVDGRFELSVRPGGMYAVAEFIAFSPKTIDILIDRESIRSGNRTVDLGNIGLTVSGIELAGIEVRAEKSETQFTLDKRVFNVGQDLANQGGTAQDILDNVPSVTVDLEGQVSLRGSAGVRILIDGRPSGLAGDNANGLRSIPANMIDRIEVITNPSARYEAEGMAGLINIVLKKDKGSGFNGSFDLSGGVPNSAGIGANVNYRKGNVNWFLNYGLNSRNNPGNSTVFQTQDRADGTYIQDVISDRNRKSLSNSVRFGIDILPSDKETITGSFLFRKSDEDNFSSIIYDNYFNDFPDNLTSSTVRTDDQEEYDQNLEYTVNYRREFSNQDHKLEASVQFQNNFEDQYSDFLELSTVFNGTPIADLIQRSDNGESEKTWLFQLDFARPLKGNNHKYEFGARSALRHIDNDYLVEQLFDANWENLANLSNTFNYDENVHALYGIYGNKISKIGFQFGLRGEYSQVLTELIQTNERNDRNYFNLFPSAHINYELEASNQLQISYSARMRRPRFWDLNPFFSFSDSRNMFSGNPNLNPELTDSYEISHIKYWDKVTLTSSFFYRHTDDTIERIVKFNSDGTTSMRPENLATRNDFGLEFTFSYTGLKWWRLDGNANFFRTITDGKNVDATFTADDITWFGRMTSRFTVFKDMDIQLRYNYRAAVDNAQGRNNAMQSVSLGISKDFFNKQATVTLSAPDIFNGRRRQGITIGEGFYRRSDFQWRREVISLSLNYRINQNKKRQRSEGGDGEGFEGGEQSF